MDTLIFSRSDIAARLPLSRCIPIVEEAFALLGRGEAAAPTALAVHAVGGMYHIKAGALRLGGREYFAAKTNGNFPANPAHGLPTIQGLLILSDAANGRVLAVMDSMELTALRTAAATAIAAKYLARAESERLFLCGCGLQARTQLQALLEVLPIRYVLVYDIDGDAALRFANEMGKLLNIRVAAVDDLAAGMAAADVCVTSTTSREFIIDKDIVRPGTFIAGVGVDNEEKRELAPDLLAASKVVTDLRAQCAQIGDLHHALAAGAMTLEDVHADLADVVARTRAGRENSVEITVFDSTGIALQDIAAAAAVYENAAGVSTGSAIRSVAFAD